MQELLVDWFGSAGATVIRYAIALVIVAGLLLLLYRILPNYLGRGVPGGRGRANRLAVVDAVTIDPKRRLLLVRRDNVEHLILVGGGNDLVVEPTIIRGVPVGSLGRLAPRTAAAGGEAEPSLAPSVAAAPLAAAAVSEVRETAPRETAPRETGPMPSPASMSPPAPRHTPVPPPPPVRAPERRPVRETPVRPPEAARTLPHVRQRPPERQRPLSSPEQGNEPFIPPEPGQVETEATPIAPIVEPSTPAEISRMPRDPAAPPVDEPGGFDDLARQLDEALKAELGHARPQPAAARPPRAPAVVAPVRSVEPPSRREPARESAKDQVAPAEAAAEPARPVLPAASAWLRPRVVASKPEPDQGPAKAPAPASKTKPQPPAAAEAAEPAVDDDLDAHLADALSEAIAAKETVKAQPKPEPTPEPTPAKAQSKPEPKPEPAPAKVESKPEPVPAKAQSKPEPAPAKAESKPEPKPESAKSEPVKSEPAKPEPAPAKAEPEAAKPAEHDFSSLEDEMARLLDELAGGSKNKR